LPELLLIEMLRLHLRTAPAAERGWLAALRDPVLAPAMRVIHAVPDRRWTVAALAARSGGVPVAAGRPLPGCPRAVTDPLPQ